MHFNGLKKSYESELTSIHFQKYGDFSSSGKQVIVNKNSFLIWKSFLEELTKYLQIKENVINEIRVLPNGEKVRILDELRPTEIYVVLENEIFSKSYYANLMRSSNDQFMNMSKQINFPRSYNKRISKNICIKNVDIKIYRNGDACSRALNVKIQPFCKYKMNNLLKIIEDQMILPSRKPIKRLYKLNGEEIKDITEMENQKHYVVASNEKFVNIKYGQELPAIRGNKVLPGKTSQIKQSQIGLNKTKENFIANIIQNFSEKMKLNSENVQTEYKNTFYTKLFAYIEMNIIGRDFVFKGPFGQRLVIYCDYTASGRPLTFIEEFISKEVLPEYSNTHTTNTVLSMQTTMFRQEARDIIRKSCNATDKDVVLFAGSGSTGAIHKLAYNMSHSKPPIIVTGPFEHHSNLLPWRKIAHTIHRIKINNIGEIDTNDLISVLIIQSKISHEENRQLIGVFSAASNVTGIVTDVNMISAIMHKYNGFVFWDYASGGPYLQIDMNPVVEGINRHKVYKDAVYFSMHKFVGGVQSPGVLIAKKNLFYAGERDPHGAGGGTVFFVGRESHLFLKDIEEREEGGTPDIVGAIRAGLAFQLKDYLNEALQKREEYLVNYAMSKFKNSKNLIILGGFKAKRIPIFSFMVRHQIARNEYLFLHHHFICSLLNDLFGVQSRSGCACAGPYGMDLLGIDEELAKIYLSLLVGKEMNEIEKLPCIPEFPKRDIFKPGFVRINLPFFMPNKEVDFVLDAILFVAEHGYKFLPQYNFKPEASEWRHVDHERTKNVKKLNSISYNNGFMNWNNTKFNTKLDYPASFTAVMIEASRKMDQIIKHPKDIPDESNLFEKCTDGLRWFLLPSEAATYIWNSSSVSRSLPKPSLFTPGTIAPSFPDYNETKFERFKQTKRRETIQENNLNKRSSNTWTKR